MRRIGGAEFAREVLQAPGAVVVKFTAPHCAPCVAIGEALDGLAPRFAGVGFLEVDVADCPDVASDQAVGMAPTVVAYVGGGETDRFQGTRSRPALEAWLRAATP